jgi:hypothetical protein
MCHNALLDSKFYAFLLRIDEDLAAETRAVGCRRCGAALHRDRYPRKPRGGPGDLGEAYRYRLSFCCAICDKRHTPVSVRFLSRRVYLAAIVVLASALRVGLTDWRVAQLTERIGIPKRTIERWRTWWLQEFVDSSFWKNACARFVPPLAATVLPANLLERFGGPDLSSQLVAALRFLTPLGEGC